MYCQMFYFSLLGTRMSQRYFQVKKDLRSGLPVDPAIVRELTQSKDLSDRQRKRARKMVSSAIASNHQPPSAILYGPFYSTRWTVDDE